MEINIASGVRNANISSKANSDFEQRGDHKSAKRISTTRKDFQKLYDDNERDCNPSNEIIIEDGISKCKNCANCDKKDSEVKPKVTVEIAMFHDVPETRI